MYTLTPSSLFILVSLYKHTKSNALPTTPKLDKGFNILEISSKFAPQGLVVQTAKEGWKFVWKKMMVELAPQDPDGAYSRPSLKFQGIIGSKEFPDEKGRYHLYTGNPCPWCHRAKLALNIRNISPNEIGQTQLIDDPVKATRGGWIFNNNQQKNRDPLFGSSDLSELYENLSPNYQGRCTAPLLVDLKSKKIVSNESSDIVRMLNAMTMDWDPTILERKINLYPDELSTEIDQVNEWVYELLNNGVYKCGFSTRQSAYDKASADVREGLKKAEEVLSKKNYLCGDVFTEADLRLLPTILRFDGAYAPLFRAGGAHLRIRDYPNILAWLQRCWDMEGVPESIDLQDATSSYYRQLFPLNAGGLVPTSITIEEIGLTN